MTKRIEKAIDIFLDALNNNTLMPGVCTACAVGNLVAHGIDCKIDTSSLTTDKDNSSWSDLFITGLSGQKIYLEELLNSKIQKNIKATDFTWEELAKIENVFETTCRKHKYYNSRHFRHLTSNQTKFKKMCIAGLSAVVEVMLKFDNCEKENNVKIIFTEKAEKENCLI